MEASSDSKYESASFTGAFFPHSRGLVVSGGTFLSVTNSPPPNPDYHRFSIADVDLIREIRLNASSHVVVRPSRRSGVRRMYSATVNRAAQTTTVAMYQGPGATEKWRKDVSMHSMFRHPNFVQIYGASSSTGNIHAIIFNDNLVPFEDHLRLHGQAHFSTIYIFKWASQELQHAFEYFAHISGKTGLKVDDCTFWYRPATGRLCLDLTPERRTWGPTPYYGPNDDDNAISPDVPSEEAIINLSDLGRYLSLCCNHLARERNLMMLCDGEFRFGSVIRWPVGSLLEDAMPIAFYEGLQMMGSSMGGQEPEDAIDGEEVAGEDIDPYFWVRCDYVSRSFHSRDVYGKTVLVRFCDTGCFMGSSVFSTSAAAWLSRANEVFKVLQIDSNFEDYVILTEVRVLLDVGTPTRSEAPPEGYLILCPPAAYFTQNSIKFQWPALPYYWSTDPFGEQRLAMEEAERLGLPAITSRIHVRGMSWDATVYEGVRRFIDMKAGSREALNDPRWPSFNSEIIELKHEDEKNSCDETGWADALDSVDFRMALESAYYKLPGMM